MLHKISAFCDKIDSIKRISDDLRRLKYETPKSKGRDLRIQNLIDTIQADCLLVASDKGKYVKREDNNGDFGVDHPSGLSIDQDE